jgi:hypothetical protein
MHDLHGFSVLDRERRAQDGMPVHETLKRLLQEIGIKRPGVAGGVGKIVRSALGNELLNEPEGALPPCQAKPYGCLRRMT